MKLSNRHEATSSLPHQIAPCAPSHTPADVNISTSSSNFHFLTSRINRNTVRSSRQRSLPFSTTTSRNCSYPAMASEAINPLEESSITMRSDSEQYSGNDELSPSPPSSSTSPPLILYTPPNVWGILRGAAINLLLPFVNGLMLGFGELFAHEAAFRLGWGGTKVRLFLLRDKERPCLQESLTAV